jgi:dienelactone hydrolase
VLVLFVVAGFGASSLIRAIRSTNATRPSSPVPTTPPRTPASPTPVVASWTGPFGVAKQILHLVDASRTVLPPHSGTSEPGPRVLPTVVWFPKLPAGTVPPPQGYPLVVFAHGFDLGPAEYAPLLRSWAARGYVVAAPSFPLTNPHAVGGLDENDLGNQPADVRFVITKLLAAHGDATSRLSGMIDRAEIAVAGHSDGGDTADAVAYNTCCRDVRIRAALVMAGAALTFPGGTYYPPGSPPLFVVQGTNDTVNRPQLSQQIFGSAPKPKASLSLLGADHLQPFTGTGQYEHLTATLTIDFLDHTLKALPDALARLRSDGRATPSLEKLTLAL